MKRKQYTKIKRYDTCFVSLGNTFDNPLKGIIADSAIGASNAAMKETVDKGLDIAFMVKMNYLLLSCSPFKQGFLVRYDIEYDEYHNILPAKNYKTMNIYVKESY